MHKSLFRIPALLMLLSSIGFSQGALPSAQQAAAKWKTAISSRSKSAGYVLTTTTTQDGISGTVSEILTWSGDYREDTKREFDHGEVVLSAKVQARKDWNGYVRTLEGLELSRYLTAAYVERALIFGPDADADLGSVSAGDKPDTLILKATPKGGSEVQWLVDAKTGLPLRSTHGGQDSAVTETYGDWKDFNGVKTAASASVKETNKPDYTWNRESVGFTRTYSFAAPTPGPSDTTLRPFRFAWRPTTSSLMSRSMDTRRWLFFSTPAMTSPR